MDQLGRGKIPYRGVKVKMKKFKRFLSNKYTLLFLRVFIGFFFIAASLDKILFPSIFKSIILEYKIIPEIFVPLVSVVMPWVELGSGLLLILDVYAQSNAFIIIILLFGYIFGISQNLIVGLIHECGCFNLLGIDEDISLITVLRDVGFILLTLPILVFSKNVLFAVKSNNSGKTRQKQRSK